MGLVIYSGVMLSLFFHNVCCGTCAAEVISLVKLKLWLCSIAFLFQIFMSTFIFLWCCLQWSVENLDPVKAELPFFFFFLWNLCLCLKFSFKVRCYSCQLGSTVWVCSFLYELWNSFHTFMPFCQSQIWFLLLVYQHLLKAFEREMWNFPCTYGFRGSCAPGWGQD